MLVPPRIKAAINSTARRVGSKWYLVIPFVLWELFKDRLANWANDKIDKSADTVMKEAARLLEWATDQPLFWTLIIVVIILVIVFIHAYITDEKPKFISRLGATDARSTVLFSAYQEEAKRLAAHAQAIVELLTSWEPFDQQEQQVQKLYSQIKAVAPLLSGNKKLRQLLRDFLNRCGIIISDRKAFDSYAEREGACREIKQMADEIGDKINGTR